MKKKNKINAITIYSQSNLVKDCLIQICKDFSLHACPYSAFTLTAVTAKASISLIDIKNQIVFDKTIKPLLNLNLPYPLIILVPKDLIPIYATYTSCITILPKPFNYCKLLQIIRNYSTNTVDRIARNIFLNSQTLSVIKVSNPRKIHEIHLTNLEYKILKYIIDTGNDNKIATEKEILTNVFGYHACSDSNTFNTHMHRLKQKLYVVSIKIFKCENKGIICTPKFLQRR